MTVAVPKAIAPAAAPERNCRRFNAAVVRPAMTIGRPRFMVCLQMSRAVTHARPRGQARLIETRRPKGLPRVKMPADDICAAVKLGVRHLPMAALVLDYTKYAQFELFSP